MRRNKEVDRSVNVQEKQRNTTKDNTTANMCEWERSKTSALEARGLLSDKCFVFCRGVWCVLDPGQRDGQFDDLVIGEDVTEKSLKATLEGRKIVELKRRGKQMWFVLDK